MAGTSADADTNESVYPSGAHYSGRNRVPNIKQFMQSLDKDKKRRDAEAEAALQAGGVSSDHVPARKPGKNRRVVRDPVTGKDVEIEDITSQHLKAANDPTVRLDRPYFQEIKKGGNENH